MTTTRNCAECDQPLPRKVYPEALQVKEMLNLRSDLASVDPSATKLGFCDRAVELASSIHVSAHSGAVAPRLRREAKRWLREANERLEMWKVAGSAQAPRTRPQSAQQRLSA